MFNNFSSIMSKHIRFNLLKNIKIPIEIFERKILSPAENVVYYLSKNKFLKQTEIAYLLKRDPRTIWTTLIRAERKLKGLSTTSTSFHQTKRETKSEIHEIIA